MATQPTSGTRTLTITLDPPSSSNSTSSEPVVLRLKPLKKKVQWKEGTVDNEHMNKKKSKKCCIFHKEKPFDEDYSDDEDMNSSNGGGGGGEGGDPGASGSPNLGACCSHGGSGAHH